MINDTVIQPGFTSQKVVQYFPADSFPTIHPIDWLHSHFAVGGWSPLQRLSGMLTAHMTRIAPHSGFTWHPHRGLEIYTWVLEGTLYHEDTTGGRGEIKKGELQRMFSGERIEHQELNLSDDPVRVIQIWHMADPQYRGLSPHYQQLSRKELPSVKLNGVQVFELVGGNSPMDQHMTGRLTATMIDAGSNTQLISPLANEDLFLYVTDGSGYMQSNGEKTTLGQYDVILAPPDSDKIELAADKSESLEYLSFYLPPFL